MSAEHRFQMAAYKYLKYALPEGSVVFSMDAGIKSSAISAMLAKQRGIVAGIPDMVVLVPFNPSIWIELKAGRGRISERQDAMHTAIQKAGHNIIVAWSLAEIEHDLRALGIPLRATTMTAAEIDTRLTTRTVVKSRHDRSTAKMQQVARVERIRSKVPF